ncbi:MAG: hypothetical protein RL499_110, partial [Actinomycetota bacterium]
IGLIGTGLSALIAGVLLLVFGRRRRREGATAAA